MIYNSTKPSLDLKSEYFNHLKENNYSLSLIEISKMSPSRLEKVEIPLVLKKVKQLIDGLGAYLDIQEDDVIRLDANMMDCVEIRFSTRNDIKVNLYVNDYGPSIEGITQVDYDDDEMYFTFIQKNRRKIMHGTMDQMIDELKTILNDT